VSSKQFDYYQTDGFITLIIPKRGVVLDKCKVIYSKDILQIFVDDERVFDAQLFGPVDQDSFHVNCTPSKVLSRNYYKFIQLLIKTIINFSFFIQKSLKINWDQIAKEADNEEENSIQALFQKIYADADDDTKKAMAKSFTESNGTVLSTNWKEIQRGKTETRPPEGMEFKPEEKKRK
ncbi:unnamed protein product, partial [Dracunculus medinensis]|uniref:SGS domain-containing protein n=1 Tax=Dracunculus medinensis TaxID=318479 RepID=A0A0N4UIX3_DRAME